MWEICSANFSHDGDLSFNDRGLEFECGAKSWEEQEL